MIDDCRECFYANLLRAVFGFPFH